MRSSYLLPMCEAGELLEPAELDLLPLPRENAVVSLPMLGQRPSRGTSSANVGLPFHDPLGLYAFGGTGGGHDNLFTPASRTLPLICSSKFRAGNHEGHFCLGAGTGDKDRA